MRLCGISCVLIVIAVSPSSPSVLGQAKSDKDQKGPTLAHVKITSTKQSPVTLEFTVEIAPSKAPLDGLFVGLGTPESLKIVAKRGLNDANVRGSFSASRASLEKPGEGSTLHKGKVVFDKVESVTNDQGIVSFLAIDDKDIQGNQIVLEVDFKTGKATEKKSPKDDGTEAVADVVSRLQGEWSIIDATRGKNIALKLDSPKLPVVSFKVEKGSSMGTCSVLGVPDTRGGRAYLDLMGLPIKSNFTVNTNGDPFTIDLSPVKGKDLRGIFRFQEPNKLLLCISTSDRPVAFGTDAKEDEFRALITLQRKP
jgi:hypothetical protein